MADTPRVTVPVEPTEAMINHAVGHIGGGSTFDTDDRREIAQSVYRAMLSAAPAPEGGAVSTGAWDVVQRVSKLTVAGGDPLQDPAFAQYPAIADLVAKAQAALAAREEAPACKKCSGKGYTEHEGGEGEGYPSRPEIEACSCREEAPAEAWKRCASCGAGPAGNCGYYDCETPRNTCPLRAQPQGLTATQLADAIDCFWNAAMGAAREHQTGTSAEVASVVAQGMAAIAQRLRENSNG